MAPAIAAGCPVVLKPASATPLTALKLAGLLLDECGLPPGWLNVVTCRGAVADHLVTHDDVAMITFTGSPGGGLGDPGGRPAQEGEPRAGQQRPGGRSSPTPTGPGRPVAKIRVAGYGYAGQSCISVQRVYVHRSIHDRFVAELVAQVDGLRGRRPVRPATDVSALITPGETERVAGWIDEAVAQGATVATGGHVVDGVLAPTVLTGVLPDMEVCRTEVFGPVVGVAAYDDWDEALRLANDTRYGLQAGGLHGRPRPGPRRRPHARLRWGPGQRGADLAGRPDALRRCARLGQHPGGPGVRRRAR